MASENGAIGEVARALMGVTFPAGKNDIAEFAHSTHPNDELVHLLAQLPDREYASMAEIEEAFQVHLDEGELAQLQAGFDVRQHRDLQQIRYRVKSTSKF